MEYKIVASDLDGTLLNNSSLISCENLEAINALSKLGIHFVTSTGRTFGEIPEQIRENADIRYYIHSNGAVVLDKYEGKRILNCIPNSICRDILNLITNYETEMNIRHNGNLIIDSELKNDSYYAYHNVIDAHLDCIYHYSQKVDNFIHYAYNADNVEVITVFFHNYADKLHCKKQLEQNAQIRVTEASEYNLEIMNANAGKGNALYALADMLGVDYAETISIGDSDNDSTIIQAAGLGLAVSNACNSLKAVADQIICSNEEHVIPYVLSHYFSKL